MSRIFISYAEEDRAITNDIAKGLEAVGYTTWYYERDSVPGPSYLLQMGEAIDEAEVLVLIVSPSSIPSNQVTSEVIRAHEKNKPFIPLLYGISHEEFQRRAPIWRQALGAFTSLGFTTEEMPRIILQIVDGLNAMGIITDTREDERIGGDALTGAEHESNDGERRRLTVMSCELESVATEGGQVDPEALRDLLHEYQELCRRAINSTQGHIANSVGGDLLVYFGYPQAREDDAQQAVHAGLEIVEEIGKLDTRLQRERAINLAVHLGVHTGLVVAGGATGEQISEGLTIAGDTPNIAMQLKGVAPRNKVLISAATHRLIEGYFICRCTGETNLRGVSRPMAAYDVVEDTGVRSRMDSSVARGLTRFVGRENSMAQLREAVEKAGAGHGQAVGIVGEAGVGKSRLLLEFKNLLLQSEHAYLEARCLHFGGSMNYLPFLDVLRSYFEIREEDPELIIKKKMAHKIAELDEKLDSDLSPLMELLSLKVEDEDYLKLGPQQKKEKTFEAIRNLLIRVSQERPLVLVVEDLHWIDKTSEEFLDYLIGSLAGVHILLILLYRPEYTHQWGSKSYYLKIGLNELTLQSSAELVTAILEGGEVAPELRELILDRAAGNPLFMEEFAHNLTENGSIHKRDHEYVLDRRASDIEVPDTLQAIIASRMDRLEDNLKQTMQVASVIGRDFAFRILQTITGMRENLKSYLISLQGLEFIYEKSLFPELEYIFKHALIQEVAYDSLLFSRRKEIHKKIGQTIENIYEDRLEEFYEMLAYHFDHGEVWNKAVEYHVKAGMKSGQNYALQTATQYFDRAKDILEQQVPEVPWRLSYDLFFEGGQILGDIGQMVYSYEDLLKASEIAKREGEKELTGQALYAAAWAAVWAYKNDESLRLLEETESLMRDFPETLLAVVSLQAFAYWNADDITMTLAKEKKAKELIRLAPRSPYFAIATFLLGHYNRWRGDAHKTLEIMDPIMPLLKKTVPLHVYLEANFMRGLALGETGRYQEAIRALLEGREMGVAAGERYATTKTTNSVGWAYHGLCHFNKAIEYNNLALNSIQELLGPGASSLFEIESQTRINLGENYLMTGDLQKARQNLELVHEHSKKPDYYFGRPVWLPRCLLALGELRLLEGDTDGAESLLAELIEHQWTDKYPYKKRQVRAWLLRSGIFSAREQLDEAEIELSRALSLAKQLGNPTVLWQTHQAMGALLLTRGKNEDASAEFKAAFCVVHAIAEGLTDAALKKGYLKSQPIQKLFSLADGS